MPDPFPFISVVIPCRNETQWISDCLASVLQNGYPQDRIEILVIDGMSTDGTQELVEQFSREHGQVRLLQNPRRIIPCALNIGICAARSNIIIRMDAHANYPRGYIERCVQLLSSGTADVVGGRVVNSVPEDASVAARVVGIITSHPFGVGASPFRTRKRIGPADSVVFGTFRRKVFEQYGLFDERLVRNQDTEMWHRIRRRGGQILFDPDIMVYYYNQRTWRGFLIQAFRTGFWCALASRLNPAMLKPRHFAPMIFVIYMMVSAGMVVAGLFTAAQWPLIAGFVLLAGYFLPDLLFSISMSRGTERIRGAPWIAPLAFFTIPLYHMTYGLGWWAGLGKILARQWTSHLGAPVGQLPEILPSLPVAAPRRAVEP